MRIALLGPLTVDTQPVGGLRLRRLLLLLALDAGTAVALDRLVDGLWSDPPAGAANAVQALVSRLRRLPGGLTVHAETNGYRLDLPPDEVDAHRFARLAAAGREAQDPRLLREALALWRGPALADAGDAEFVTVARARLDELRLTCEEDRIEADLRLGRAADAATELAALTAVHPLRERLAGLRMRALAASGRRAEALAAYDQTRTALAEHLGVEPGPELSALHLSLLRAAEVVSGSNLRTPLTSFHGRDEELAGLVAALDAHRLVTLTGPGGAGKTRLATEYAHLVRLKVPDGVWLVELAAVTDPAAVPDAVGAALGSGVGAPVASVPVRGGDPVERLAFALAERELLLVLDNCEHLVGAVAALVERLLGDAPGLRVLATSREPLAITGEVRRPVEPLPLPPPDADARVASEYPSVLLFAGRAAAVRPGFVVDARSVGAVVRICRAVDGIPLALELAAARLSALSAEQVAARIGDRFALLAKGSRTALPRQQTLRGAVDWSWDLLTEPERVMLRRLCVFTGSGALSTVEAVCGAPPLSPGGVLDLLESLVDKSLVVVSDGRYGMLETIRAYAAERLDEAGESDAVRLAHAVRLTALAEEAEPFLRTGAQVAWLERLNRERDNLAAALRWTAEHGHPELTVRMTAALGWYWWLCGHRLDVGLVGPALEGPADVPRTTRALAYAACTLNVLSNGDAQDSDPKRWYRKALEHGAGFDAPHPFLRLMRPVMSLFESARGADPSALPSLLFHDPDPWVRALGHMLHAHLEINEGRQSDDHYEAALSGFTAIGERWGMAGALTAIGTNDARDGNWRQAVVRFGEALELMRAMGVVADVPQLQSLLAQGQWMLGERDLAWRTLAEAEELARRSGTVDSLVSVEYSAGELHRAEGDLDAARERLERARGRLTRVLAPPQMVALVDCGSAYVALAKGDLDEASALHTDALRVAIASGDGPVIGQVLVGVADLMLRRGEPARAARLLGASHAARGGPDLSYFDGPRVAAAVRAALSTEDFAREFAHGAADPKSALP
ncbi:SARP family transcriptional regulator [Virgisporangium aliadipatigenens]|uniref:SARP family transcriptional regulator n=1 Tax=Virgisporangium aliadipatigenens TaxID=741659 RepID=A0A8J4DRM4_9ACTN|nr:BTAD domain-containing putative transcriptional regulator [Virgisporangium aliadipatigenens]GIJ46933.1 SARP family transcriptional regulator [Virgisporangium aliadipatigenens]